MRATRSLFSFGCQTIVFWFCFFFFNPYLRIFLLALRERERERCEKHQLGCLLLCAPTEGQTCNLGMCPDWELIPQILVYGTMLQPSHTGQGPCSFNLFQDNNSEQWPPKWGMTKTTSQSTRKNMNTSIFILILSFKCLFLYVCFINHVLH